MLYLTRHKRKEDKMSNDTSKQMKCVVSFLSGLALIVLGSFIVDKNINDLVYFLVTVLVIIRYMMLCRK